MSEERDYTVGSGNVFVDLGVPEPEEALAKAKLAHAINEIIARRRLTQARAAEILGIDQPKVSALKHGRLCGFSTERLFRLLIALDHNVEIVVTPKTPSQPRAGILVSADPKPVR